MKIKITKILFVVSVFVLNSILVYGRFDSTVDENNQQEAKRIWELAIQAKGGREKLLSVKNMVVSSEGIQRKGLKKINVHLEDFYVFPNKWWSWSDQRPTVFGLRMRMNNWETMKQYVSDFQGEASGLKQIESNEKPSNFAGLNLELLETKWNQPIPESVTSGKVEGVKVNIIRTSLSIGRVDFAISKESYLPVKVTLYSNQKISNSIKMLNYVDVNGVKMPSKIVFESSDSNTEYKRAYQFNVEYDESIFTTPPLFEAGREVWKARK